MVSRRLTLVLLTSIHAAPVAGQNVETIDLRLKPPAVVAPSGHLTFAGAASTDAKPEVLPLEVSVRWLDRDTYRYFDTLTYRVRLTNSGPVPVSVPRLRAPVLVGSDRRPQVVGRLELIARLRGSEHLMHSIALMATATDPAESRLLQPGESVELIAAGRWEFLTPAEGQDVLRLLPAKADLMARFHLRWPDGPRTLPVSSSNSLPVTLLPYQPPHRAKPVQ